MELKNVQLAPDGRAVVILDQTLLPGEVKYLTLSGAEELWEAIASLRVRGAPAIGIFAGYALYVLARSAEGAPYGEFLAGLRRWSEYLNGSRPTAVNLSWALSRMERAAAAESTAAALAAMAKECRAIHSEEEVRCRRISENGLSLLRDGAGVLTHCNAGPLATAGYGTGLGPLLLGRERGLSFRVFCDETRPLLQGARLTALELMNAGLDVTLICDNMASLVMRNGWIDACLVGCDRVAANGDTANKIGTSGVAILARHYGVPFYVLGPSSTIDPSCATGADIRIEQRAGDEIYRKFFASPTAPEGVRCYNPAFDVTDASLITAIVTEDGIFRPPYKFV